VAFRFVAFRFVALRFVAFRFVAFRFVAFRFVAFPFVAFRFVAFRFVAFRFVAFRFVALRLVALRFVVRLAALRFVAFLAFRLAGIKTPPGNNESIRPDWADLTLRGGVRRRPLLYARAHEWKSHSSDAETLIRVQLLFWKRRKREARSRHRIEGPALPLT
jgi:hypothetical protein